MLLSFLNSIALFVVSLGLYTIWRNVTAVGTLSVIQSRALEDSHVVGDTPRVQAEDDPRLPGPRS